MIYFDNEKINDLSYIDNNNKLWVTNLNNENLIPEEYRGTDIGLMNAVYYNSVLVWGRSSWANTRLKHFALGAINTEYYTIRRESIENLPSTGYYNVSTSGFPAYITPEPVWPEDMTVENMEYPKSTSYRFFVYDDVKSIILNENCQNMFRNAFQRSYYMLGEGIIEYLNFRYVRNMARMFEDCRFLGYYPTMPSPTNSNYNKWASANNLLGRVSRANLGIENMYRAFYECAYLRGQPECPTGCVNFREAYFNCGNIIGFFECGDSVTDMAYAYFNCYNVYYGLTYNIGNSVINMAYAYYRTRISDSIYNAENMIGIPNIPASVKNMSHAFDSASCGNTAKSGITTYDLSHAYANSIVYTVAGSWDNAKNLDYCFAGLRGGHGLWGDLWLNYRQFNQASEGVSALRMLEGRAINSAQTRLNIHVKPGSFWNAWFWQHGNDVIGNTLSWTLNQAGEFYYNTSYNLYIYYADTYKPGGVDLKKFGVKSNTGYDNMRSVYVDRDIDADINID